eukprot:11552484-Alexandrium_andersonii.AAC.1
MTSASTTTNTHIVVRAMHGRDGGYAQNFQVQSGIPGCAPSVPRHMRRPSRACLCGADRDWPVWQTLLYKASAGSVWARPLGC